MKAVIIFVCLFAVALAEVTIVNSGSDVQADHYSYAFDTSDGTHHEESGHLEHAGSEDESIAVQGNFAYKDEKTGQVYSVAYTADATGFHPQGAHLPVA